MILAAVLGSGMAFLDGTVVNVALPAIGDDLDAGLTGLQWTIDAYLVTLSALLLLGGALGDIYGRRRLFIIGIVGFSIASIGCALAPSAGALIAARAVQGVAAALLVPGSLSLISASFHPDDRSKAVGAWSGLSGISSALGPFLGGWLIDAVSWRWIFLLNVPLAAATLWATIRYVPESKNPEAWRTPDVPGAITVSVGLAGVAYALIEGPAGDVTPLEIVVGVLGALALAAFPLIERRHPHPMVPPELFKSRQFTGANLTTLAVYMGLGGAMFLVVLQLQLAVGYSALQAGASFLPITLLLLVLSPKSGELAQRIGPRVPMTIGPFLVGGGLLLLTGVEAGSGYLTGILPGLVVFGLGLAATVAPLTAAVLSAVEEHHVGVGSGVNNAVARVAGLIAVALLPAVAGVDTTDVTTTIPGYDTALRIAAAVAALGGAIAWLTIRTSRAVEPTTQASVLQPCHDPSRVGVHEGEAA